MTCTATMQACLAATPTFRMNTPSPLHASFMWLCGTAAMLQRQCMLRCREGRDGSSPIAVTLRVPGTIKLAVSMLACLMASNSICLFVLQDCCGKESVQMSSYIKTRSKLQFNHVSAVNTHCGTLWLHAVSYLHTSFMWLSTPAAESRQESQRDVVKAVAALYRSA